MRKSKAVVIAFVVLVNIIFFQNCSKNESASMDQSSNAETVSIGRTPMENSFNLQSFEAAQKKVEASWLETSVANNTCLPQDLYPKAKIPAHLKYLSMVDEMVHILPFDGYWKSETNQVAKYGNVITLALSDTSSSQLSQLEQKLAYLKSINRKAAINVQTVFYDKSKLQKWADYQQRWSKFSELIKPYEKIVIAFYLYDEPFWDGVNKQVSEPTIFDYLTEQNRIVKNSFPGIATAFVEAWPMINDSLRIPPGIDWVGLDCYNSFDKCGNATYGYKSIPEYYEILKSKLTPYQKLVAIPNGIILDNEKYREIESRSNVPLADRLNTVNIAEQYFQWIANEKRIVGAFTFIYKYRGNEEGVVGPADMCEVAEHFEKNGQKFLASNQILASVNTLNVSIVGLMGNKTLSLVENKNTEVSSLTDLSIKFNIVSSSDLYNLRCELVNSKGVNIDCSALLQSGFSIPANVIESYKIQLSQGPIVKSFGLNVLAQPKKSCVYEGETTPDGCKFAPVTLAHGLNQTLQSTSSVVGSIAGTCNDGQWVNVQKICKKSCVYAGETTTEGCKYPALTLSHGKSQTLRSTSSVVGSVSATCDNGQWINVQKSCLVVKKSCSYSGETTPQGCRFPSATVAHGESRTLQSNSGIPGSISGTCNDGQWVNPQVSCTPPKKSCNYSGETTPQGCRFPSATVAHGESRTLQSNSGIPGSISGTCNDGQWVNPQVSCTPPKKSCTYAGGNAAGGACIFPSTSASHGQSKTVNAISGGTGSVTATCNDGQWVDLKASCR